MKVLVTGATGFIGRHLVRMLTQRDYAVHALCRPHADISELVSLGAKVCPGDILEPAGIRSAVDGCDCVYHLAAYARNWARDGAEFFRVNVGGFRNIIRESARAGVRRIVHTSTEVTFGPSNGQPVDETTDRTAEFLTDYEASKAAAERSARDHHPDELEIVTVHPTRVFGPGLMSEANSATRLIALYISGKWRVVPGDGRAIGNYAFVHDAALGHVLAMEHGRPGRSYILGGTNISYDDFFDLISKIADKKHFTVHIPQSVTMAISKTEELRARYFNGYPAITPGWARTFLVNWACTSALAEQEIGYRITPLAEALATTIEWIRTKHKHLEGKP